MLRVHSLARPAAGCRGRVLLRLETLEGRDHPSSLAAPEFILEPPLAYTAPAPAAAETADQAPRIVDFTAEEVGNGLYIFTGRVLDETPAGMIVTFGGDVPTMQGQTAGVQSDGTFTLIIRLRTDGTDVGFVTATTVDAQGVASNEAVVFVSPTPPPP
jgi:hypothetical protein